MPEKADGSIIISAEVDDKRAQSQFNALEKKVKKLQNSIEDMQSKRSPLVEQMQAYGAELDKAKAKLAELKKAESSLLGQSYIGESPASINREISNLTKDIEEMQTKRTALSAQMDEYASAIERAKSRIAELRNERKELERDAHVARIAQNFPNLEEYREYINNRLRTDESASNIATESVRIETLQKAWEEAKQGLQSYDTQLAATQEKLEKVRAASQIAQQEKEVAKLEKTWADVSKQVGFYDEKIKSAQVEIERASEEAAEIVERTNASAQATENMAKAAKKAEGVFSRILKRIKGVAMSAFLFSAAYKGFNALSSYLGRMIKTNEKFADSLARIKGNLLTAFQPIYEAVSPALETMLGLVADVTRGIAQFVSVIFGKSVKSSAEAAKKQYEMSDAIESTGEAAEQAQKSLASFDELNILDTSANADASGVTDAADEIEASFELVEDAATESWVDKLTNSNFGKGFVRFWKKLKGILTPAFETIWDGVTTALGWVINKILNANPNAYRSHIDIHYHYFYGSAWATGETMSAGDVIKLTNSSGKTIQLSTAQTYMTYSGNVLTITPHGYRDENCIGICLRFVRTGSYSRPFITKLYQ